MKMLELFSGAASAAGAASLQSQGIEPVSPFNSQVRQVRPTISPGHTGHTSDIAGAAVQTRMYVRQPHLPHLPHHEQCNEKTYMLDLWWQPWPRLGSGELLIVTAYINGHVIHHYEDGTTRFVGHLDNPSVPQSILPAWRSIIEAQTKLRKQSEASDCGTEARAKREELPIEARTKREGAA